MSKTQWLVMVGCTANVVIAAVAFRTGNVAGGVVILVATLAWLWWAFVRGA